jgi:hypothetical protein
MQWEMMVGIVVCCFFGSMVVRVDAWSKADEMRKARKGNSRVVLGAFVGEVSIIREGLHEGGSVHAILSPMMGENIIKMGKYGVDFPYAPAVHLAVHEGCKETLEAAFYLMNKGADINDYEVPQFHVGEVMGLSVNVTGRGLGYPPAILLALGLGMEPANAHAALLQRLYMSIPSRFNFTVLNQWRASTGNPPLMQIALLKNFFDGMFVLGSVMGQPFNETDCHGVTALHVGKYFRSFILLHLRLIWIHFWCSAAWIGHREAVNYLLYSGAKRFAVDDFGRTALHYAAIRGFGSVIQSLLSNQDENEFSKQDYRSSSDDEQDVADTASKSDWASNSDLPASMIKLQKRQYLLQLDKNGDSALELALRAPSLPSAVSALKVEYNALRLVAKEKFHRPVVPRSQPFLNRDLDHGGPTTNDGSCDLAELLKDSTKNFPISSTPVWAQLRSCSTIRAFWHGEWFHPPLCVFEDQSCGSRNAVGVVDTFELAEPSHIRSLISFKNNIDFLDVANMVTDRTFYDNYILMQRPVLIANAFSNANIWADWRKSDFLRKFGHLRVASSYYARADQTPDSKDMVSLEKWIRSSMLDQEKPLSSFPLKCTSSSGCSIDLHHDSNSLFSTVVMDEEESSAILHESIPIPDIFRVCSDSLPVVQGYNPYSAESSICLSRSASSSPYPRNDLNEDTQFAPPSGSKIVQGNKAESVGQDSISEMSSSEHIQLHIDGTRDLNGVDIDSLDDQKTNELLDQLLRDAEQEYTEYKHLKAVSNTEKMKLVLNNVGSGDGLHQHNASWTLLLTGIVHWFIIPPDALNNEAISRAFSDWAQMSDRLTSRDIEIQDKIRELQGGHLRNI